MSSSRIVAVIFSLICCSLQIPCNGHTVSSIYYRYNQNIEDKQLIVGKHHFDGGKLLYAICTGMFRGRNVNCTVHFSNNAFDQAAPVQNCNFTLSTGLPDVVVYDVLEINLWDGNKAILTWREVSARNLRYATIVLKTIQLKNCLSVNYKLIAENRVGMKPQVFITPYKTSYEVLFNNGDLCGDYFCKVVTDRYGVVNDPSPLFSNWGIITDVIPIENQMARKLVIDIGPSVQSLVQFNLTDGSNGMVLETAKEYENYSWSTSSGIISICRTEKFTCTQFDYTGVEQRKVTLNLAHRIQLFAELYNLPNGEMLALVCNSLRRSTIEDNHYYIVKFNINGQHGKTISVDEFKCKELSRLVTTKFFMINSMKYCLSIFHRLDSDYTLGRYKYLKYCFLLEELS